MRYLALCVIVLVGLTVAPPPPPPAAPAAPATVVYLIRHAEKVKDGSADPGLDAKGQKRAENLVARFAGAKLQQIHTTDFARTRNTVAPLARAQGLLAKTYNPRDLRGLAMSIRAAGGRHLVVGHSNTTPALAKLLSGADAGPAIDEPTEYDRIYVITMDGRGTSSLVRLRY